MDIQHRTFFTPAAVTSCSGVAYLLVCTLGSGLAPASEPPITALAFAPSGASTVAVSQWGLQRFSWPDLERQRSIESSAANLHCVAFSPNGMRLAIGGGAPSEQGIVEVFSWPSGELECSFSGHDDSVRSLVWLSDRQLLSASIDHTIKRWDIDRKTAAVQTYRGHSRSVDAICVLKGGNILVSAGVDQSVRVWDVKTGGILRSLNQHTKPISALAVRPSSTGLPMVASAAGDRTVRFWQPTIGRMVRYVRLKAEPLNVAWLRDGQRIAASCVDGRIRVVDADTVRVEATISAIEGWGYAIAVHPFDGSLAVGGSDSQIRRIHLPPSDETLK